ncbi:monovalent cation/H+ antiporter subunit E [Halalkalicoccus tibetensis]|uniref:Monovalent cation/H+ antiporter subunit E n=1 Tax=Halalkalicoccus tibetensis TaxID=175632 RepID=A0ABD5V961_9EURY
MATDRVLVPIEQSVTLRRTVAYAVDSVRESDGAAELHFVAAVTDDDQTPTGRAAIEDAESLLDRIRAWVHEDGGESIPIETAVVGTDRYLFSPRDYADRLAEYADEHAIDRAIIDPEYRPGASAPMLRPIEHRLEEHGLTYEEAPVSPATRRDQFVTAGGASRFLTLFLISFGFYLVLGDPTYWFDLVTGTVSGLIVAITLSHVTFPSAPTASRSPIRTLRFFVLYVPYLLFEIVKSNILIAAVILRPSMPIEPRLTRVRMTIPGGLPLTALANSITLTPGTLTVRADDQDLIVHALIPETREGLFEGSLERAVRFVFYGRAGARIPSPEERGDAELLRGEDS